VAAEAKNGRRDGRWDAESSLEELALLAGTAGARVVGKVVQRLERPDPAYYVGRGKLQEIVSLRNSLNYDLVIFDDELSPVQQRNLERALQVKVLDRTALILDIFAQHARTREGRLQVELAQHEYLLPRLRGQWSHLERLGGGIGTRGPGETQLETDRRLIKRRIQHLRRELEEVRKHRALHRRRRAREGLPLVSLVGYTNAGKSTLMRALSGAEVLVADQLFATLDPLTRRVRLPGGDSATLTLKFGGYAKVRDEFEYAIPVADAAALEAFAIGRIIKKVRHLVPGGRWTFEVDEFSGALSGLVIAELETPDEVADDSLPTWLGREVTGIGRYYNAALAFDDRNALELLRADG